MSCAGFAGLVLLLTTRVLAQNEPSTEPDRVILSPFEVNAERDMGYQASGVQSGTRLRTDLRDVAASISVVTKDYLQDIAATNLEGLMVYTLGTEVGGRGGNFSDAGVIDNPNGSEINYDAAFASAQPSTRVRGLTRADISRDFFITGTPPDSYNIDRVEISRGANAMLFGLGSPAGIINSSLIRANLSRRRTELELQTDQYGTFRSSLDHNEVLIPGKLAVRVAGLYEDTAYKIEEAGSYDRRFFGTFTYRPFKNTTLRASYEHGDIDSNRPEIRPPGDAYTYWWDLGKPVYDPSTGVSSLMGTVSPGWPSPLLANGTVSTNVLSSQIGAISAGSRQMLLVYNDPTSSIMSMGLPGQPGVVGMRGGDVRNVHPNAAGTALVNDQLRGLRDLNRINNNLVHVNDITRNFWKATQITDPAIYDFYHHQLDGVDKREFSDWNTLNITGEQLFFGGKAGIEVAYNREELDNGSAMPLDSTISGYTLRIDVNTHLPDGTPNPNFGRPFTTAYSRSVVTSSDRDVGRATAFYDLDLHDLGPKWLGYILGHHRAQLSHTRQEQTTLLENGNFYFNNGIDYITATRGSVSTASSATRGAMIMRYLGPNVSGSSSVATGAVVTPVSQFPDDVSRVNLYWYDEPTTTATSGQHPWTTREFGLLSADLKDPSNVRRDNLRYTKEKVNSTVAILQSYWLDGNLVSTLGARRDHVMTFDAGTPPSDPATGLAILGDDYLPLPVSNATVDNFNWGLVVHSPAWLNQRLPFGTELSAFYNKAENFAPAGQRYDIYDNPLPHETGETTDYGVMISTFGGRFELRAAHYETVSGQSSTLGNLTTPLNNLADFLADVQGENLRGHDASNAAGVAAWNDWYNSPTGQALRGTFRVQESPNPGNPELATVTSDRRSGAVVAPSDVVSTGEEYEVIFNPTRNWRISFNAAKAEAVRTNVATELRALVFNELVPLMDGPAGSLRGDDTNAIQTASLRFRDQIYNQMLPRLAEEGLPTNELRKWRWNLVTNYTFSEGFLDGFNVGMGVRWQDRAAIGTPIISDPVFGPSPDVRHPYYAPSETNYDAWIGYRHKFRHFSWAVQLNVHNIGVGNELIPVSAQPDGSIAGWRIAASQYWSLRNTFTF
ncbi:MAG TPA: TonB-dependent receptor plug domain-containing protein [Opitutaceae bacterium]|nr:TonB-dependent receptor plug domain-containing protein [Opitutaceae bacterium]